MKNMEKLSTPAVGSRLEGAQQTQTVQTQTVQTQNGQTQTVQTQTVQTQTVQTQTVQTQNGDLKLQESFIQRRVKALFDGAKVGTLLIILPNGQEIKTEGSATGPHATIIFHRWWSIAKYLSGGDLAFAESYMEGDVDIPDRIALFEWYIKNEKALAPKTSPSLLSRLMNRFMHLIVNDNDRDGSARNIAYHYDLGNEFYSQWLDQTMTYSAADFTDTHDLQAAQLAKYDKMIKAADIRDGAKVLEIGCGWGGFAERLLSRQQAIYKGITISAEQLDYARRRLDQGVEGRKLFYFEDYRDSKGQYDNIVSIEMFEAVGEKHWDTYFKAVADLLKSAGKAAIQTITIDHDRFLSYRENVDFIQKYIFPGGMLPSKRMFKQKAEEAGLVVTDSYSFGKGYAETLRRWKASFLCAWPAIESQGFDERFKRMWLYYLDYCTAGFEAETIDVVQFSLAKNAKIEIGEKPCA